MKLFHVSISYLALLSVAIVVDVLDLSRVRRDLANARMGQLVGSTAAPTRSRRGSSRRGRGADRAGCPVVTYFAGGRLVWHDEDDAWPAWADARSASRR